MPFRRLGRCGHGEEGPLASVDLSTNLGLALNHFGVAQVLPRRLSPRYVLITAGLDAPTSIYFHNDSQYDYSVYTQPHSSSY